MELEYSTDTVEQSQRFEYWSEVVCKHFIPAGSEVQSRQHFSARFAVRSLGNLTLASMSSPLHFWTRDAHHLRTGPNDDFMLSAMIKGDGQLTQDGRQAHQRGGDMVLYDAARLFTFDLEPESALLLRIPRKQLLLRVPEAANLTAIRLAADHPIGRLFKSMICEAAVLDLSGHDGMQNRLASSLLDMLAALLEFQIDDSSVSRSTHDKQFHKACEYITANLDDCDIDVEQIAAVQHVSTRTLTRIFAEHGTTPMRFLWKQRLEASHCAMRERRVKQVTQAAFQYGFSDLSHFCRLFKKTYGVTPQTLLRDG